MQATPTKWSLNLIGELEWKRFEEVCAHYFQLKGRKTKLTKRGDDGGIDIYLYYHDSPHKVIGVVQCKAWRSERIGVGQIREFYGVIKNEDCKLGVFFTTSSYTKPARKWAEKKDIVLVDKPQLLEKIQELSGQQQKELLFEATKGDYRTPTCVNCDPVKFVLHKDKPSSQLWRCPNYRRCKKEM